MMILETGMYSYNLELITGLPTTLVEHGICLFSWELNKYESLLHTIIGDTSGSIKGRLLVRKVAKSKYEYNIINGLRILRNDITHNLIIIKHFSKDYISNHISIEDLRALSLFNDSQAVVKFCKDMIKFHHCEYFYMNDLVIYSIGSINILLRSENDAVVIVHTNLLYDVVNNISITISSMDAAIDYLYSLEVNHVFRWYR